MPNDDPSSTGRYLGRVRPDGPCELWWDPPGAQPPVLLPAAGHRSPDGPNWGYAGNGPYDAAEAILGHALDDRQIAGDDSIAFARDVLRHQPTGQNFDLPVHVVQNWLAGRGLTREPHPGRQPPGPAVELFAEVGGVERYGITLDGTTVLYLDVGKEPNRVSVSVRDVRSGRSRWWSTTVTTTDDHNSHRLSRRDRRVGVDPMPFGGWAVQVDGLDVAIVERSSERPAQVRVSVYDRGFESGSRVFDGPVRYRPSDQPPVPIADLLRRYTDTPGRARVIGR